MVNNFSFGIEIEYYGISNHVAQAAFLAAGIKGWSNVTDGTNNVDGEAVSAPMAICATSYASIKLACETLEAAGAKINIDCGLHVHIGNALLNDNVTCEQYTSTSIAYNDRTGLYHTDHKDPFDIPVVKDVAIRYAKSVNTPNGIPACLAKSRRTGGHGYRWAVVTSEAALQPANTLEELKAATQMGRSNYSRKYSAINFLTWSNGTIEFRQHGGTMDVEKIWNWVLFLTNMFDHTIENRISTGTQTIVHDTPSRPPFREGGRVIDQYNLMRVAGGCTTRDIMMITGCSEGSVRRASSLIRDRLETNGFPRSSVITHDQISNGHQYGDGTDLSGYEIALEVTVQGTGAALMSENSIGNASIWAGVSDQEYEWWQARIVALS